MEIRRKSVEIQARNRPWQNPQPKWTVNLIRRIEFDIHTKCVKPIEMAQRRRNGLVVDFPILHRYGGELQAEN